MAAAAPWCQDGLMERFHIDEVYGMHNFPVCPLESSRCGPAL